MNPLSQRLSVKDIYLAAIELQDATERDVFLDAAVGQDADLRQQIERMIRAKSESHASPLDGVVGTEVGDAQDHCLEAVIDLSDHPLIGRYKLLEQIGQGGMGSVYMAQQMAPIKRKVALKVIKAGMDSKEVIARFEAERQALGLMDHPNIAKVLDGGSTEQGRPYFVMELVRGIPITEFCDRQQLDLRERITLFVDVCKAVQHAHQKGVIHRDLKPSNLLVTMHDHKAVAKVIDFGVAKALNQELTERTLFTHFTQMIGTPLYMAPEQTQMSGLDIDTRSDIYSLGVVLYELLTGTTPFDRDTVQRSGWDEMRRLICEVDPERPSVRISTLKAGASSTVSSRQLAESRRLRLSLRGELDWIVMMSLEKDRARRYESASALAADVERFLNDEPVQACPPSTVYRLKKYGKRHLALFASTSAIVVSLLAGTGFSLWQAGQATAERSRAFAAEERAQIEAGIASAVNRFLNEDLLAQANPSNQPDPDVTLRSVVDRAAERVSGRFAEQPKVELAIRFTLANT